jgi:alcohol dehydrogenase class IV
MVPFQHTPSGPAIGGPGVAKTVGEKTLLKKHERVLVVTDATVRAAGLVADVLASLGERAVIVDDGCVPDGDTDHTEALAATARDAGVTAICAVGGGSVMDTAKGVGAVMATGQSLRALEGIAKVKARTAPLVCIPTTAGTGSEATQFCVIKDRRAHEKRILVDTNLIPALAVLDPVLLVGLPATVTAATAIDGLTHAVEALVSRLGNPIGTALARQAITLIAADDGLAQTLRDPTDVDARGRSLLGAHLAGQAVNTSMLGACHALAHVVGARFGVPHGVANGLFLVDVMKTNATKVGAAYAALGPLLGVTNDVDAVIAAVEHLVFDVASIPRRLRDVAPITTDELPALAAAAAKDPDLPTNPVRLDEKALLSLLIGRW